jgi:hypothetical protein
MTRLGFITGLELLRDMFSSVNNRANGFERNLRTGRYTRTAADRINSTDFSDRQHGEQERMRRVRQLNKRGLVRVVNVESGETALARDLDGNKVHIQMDKFDHPHSHGWWPYAAHRWAVRS